MAVGATVGRSGRGISLCQSVYNERRRDVRPNWLLREPATLTAYVVAIDTQLPIQENTRILLIY